MDYIENILAETCLQMIAVLSELKKDGKITSEEFVLHTERKLQFLHYALKDSIAS